VTALIDCHAHLHDEAFDADRYEVIGRAAEAGVESIVTSGTDVATSVAAVLLAEHEPRVLATAGIHPHESAAAGHGDLERLSEIARSERVVAIGEIGLDYHYDFSARPVQRERFAEQLELADRLLLPVVIHSREADEDTFAILRSWSQHRKAAKAQQPFGLMHCYSYGPNRVGHYLDLGFMISIPGIVTFPKAEEEQLTARCVDLDSIVVETDCPYLTPQSRRGRRNEPGLVAETARKVAELRDMAFGEFAERTTRNARALYRLPQHKVSLRGAGDGPAQEDTCKP
jgi:TatD DNase family protein